MPRWIGGTGSFGNDAFTKVLLHFDGANGSTSFPDTAKGASAPHAWTSHGGAQLNSAHLKFGTSSLLNGATPSWIDTPDSADFTLGALDFTVDSWIYSVGITGATRILAGQISAAANDLSFYLGLNPSNQITAFLSTDGVAGTAVNGTSSVSINTWHHFAFVRKGNILKLFLDGIQEGGDQAFTGPAHDSSSSLSILRPGDDNALYFASLVDEFRMSIGIARWSANFTPPTRAYLPT
jgi:hypothetical protein